MAFHIGEGTPQSETIWVNGELIPWDEAKIHVLSHVLHYGSALFEGMRCYETERGPAIFRLKEHTERLFNSCKIYRMPIAYGQEAFNQAVVETIKVNRMRECYIRPIIFRGLGTIGVNPLKCPVDVVIAVWKWGKYLGPEALEQGVDVCVSTWARMAPNTMPAMAKCSSNYMNSQLIKMEAVLAGYTEGIALDARGFVSEGSGENLFLVQDETLYTPPVSAAILPGITRDTILTIARDLDLTVREERIPREMLYLADEVFFTGTASEVTPIRSIDRIQVGNGGRGPVTKRIQDRYFEHVLAKREDRHRWLTFVSGQ